MSIPEEVTPVLFSLRHNEDVIMYSTRGKSTFVTTVLGKLLDEFYFAVEALQLGHQELTFVLKNPAVFVGTGLSINYYQ